MNIHDIDDLDFDNLDELQAHLDKVMKQQNNLRMDHFEGFSPLEMQEVLYKPFEKNCPIQLKKLAPRSYKKIPMLNQIKFLMNKIDESKEIKLTAKGFLPTKLVAEIYSQEFIKDEMIESGLSKLYKETDAESINITRILIEVAGISKKRKNKLSLTKTGKTLLNNDEKLLKLILLTFGTKFNWAFYDGYGENGIGQQGFAFTFFLLHKYGKKKRSLDFYAKKYLTAFPMLLDYITPTSNESTEETASSCYNIRTFNRFINYFGLINLSEQKNWNDPQECDTTDIFNKLIEIKTFLRKV